MVKKKVCVECGIAFVPMARNQITCSKECSLKRKRAVQRRLNEEYREKMKVETFRRKAGRSLAETARLARAAGMSYGQYMARMKDVMTETERKAIRKGLSLMREACTGNTDRCKSCEYFNKQTGCMFKTKPYPSRWRLERG